MSFWAQFTRLPPLVIRGRGLAEMLGTVKGRLKPPTTVRPESQAVTRPTEAGRE